MASDDEYELLNLSAEQLAIERWLDDMTTRAQLWLALRYVARRAVFGDAAASAWFRQQVGRA